MDWIIRVLIYGDCRCKTVVPDTFMVLLSQRRRWINSTIHNLMELLFVNDLCGTFCFSMQFVVFMELVGTLVRCDSDALLSYTHLFSPGIGITRCHHLYLVPDYLRDTWPSLRHQFDPSRPYPRSPRRPHHDDQPQIYLCHVDARLPLLPSHLELCASRLCLLAL